MQLPDQPTALTYVQLFGAFDYNKTQLAPLGLCVLAHEEPNQCGMWAPHGAEQWYIGPAMDHYCIVITKMNATQIMDTLVFFPCKFNMPTTSLANLAIWAVKDLIYALCHPHPTIPYSSIGDAQLCALSTLVDIFNDALPGMGVLESQPM